jgi:hypothetical protein
VSEASEDTALGGDPGRQVLSRLYEEIRSWVLDPSREPWKAACHFGWGVLVQRGMAAWMQSCLGFSVTNDQDAAAAALSVPVPALRSNPQPARGLQTGAGAPFSSKSIRWVRYAAGLKSLRQRLRAAGWLTTQELSAKLGVHYSTVKEWRRKGLIHARPSRDRGEWLFDPNQDSPKSTSKSLSPQQDQPQLAKPAAGGAV